MEELNCFEKVLYEEFIKEIKIIIDDRICCEGKEVSKEVIDEFVSEHSDLLIKALKQMIDYFDETNSLKNIMKYYDEEFYFGNLLENGNFKFEFTDIMNKFINIHTNNE